MVSHTAGSPDRDFVTLQLQMDGDNPQLIHVTAVGCLPFLAAVEDFRQRVNTLAGQRVDKLPVPTGNFHHEILLREVVLKAQGKWNPPIEDDPVCKCRKVSSERIISCVSYGCHMTDKVGQVTTAGTGCGTCRPRIEEIIRYVTSYHSNQE